MIPEPIEPPDDAFTPADVRRWIAARASDPRTADVSTNLTAIQ